MAIKESNKDLTAREKAEALEGAVLKSTATQTAPFFTPAPQPVPVGGLLTPHETRIAALEAKVKVLTDKLDAAVLTPVAYGDRLDAIEKLVRSHAETIGSVKQPAPKAVVVEKPVEAPKHQAATQVPVKHETPSENVYTSPSHGKTKA